MMKRKFHYKVAKEITQLDTEVGPVTGLVRKVSWAGADDKVDIRYWYSYGTSLEAPGKGICLDDEKVDKLVEALVKEGYGRKEVLEQLLSNRVELERKTAEEIKPDELQKEDEEFFSAKDVLTLSYEE